LRTSILVCVALLSVAGCGSGREAKTEDRQALRPVALPDLSRIEESVQTQLRERYASLTTKQNDPTTRAGDLAAEYGAMGMLLLAAELRAPAEAALLDAETLAPGDMRWPYYLGHLYRVGGDIPRATAAFERALRLAPSDVPTMTWIAEAALDAGRPEAAEPLFAKALSLQPRSAAAHYGLGRAALAGKQYARAVEHLEEALALESKATVIHYSLAMAYRGLGDHAKAELHLRQRGVLSVDADALTKTLDELLNSALTYEKNADVAGARGEWTRAAELLKKAVALAPTRASPRHKLGTARFYLGDRRGAVDQFQQTLTLAPAYAASHYALGVIYQDAREHQQALASFSAALASEPGNLEARARFGYAAALIRLNRYQEASARLAEAMDLFPNDLSFVRAAARVFAAAPDDRVRNGGRAVSMAQALMNRQPKTVDLVETMAMALAEVGQYSDAARWQREAIDAAERAGHRPVVERLRANLDRYQAGQPCRTPWRADEAIEF
jgi:tetratricopeptide (TPR) repeat protein